MRGVQVEWVAAGVAAAVGVGVQDATGGIQMLAAVVYTDMLVFAVLGDTGKLIEEKTKKKKVRKNGYMCTTCVCHSRLLGGG